MGGATPIEAPQRGGDGKALPFWCVSTPRAAGVKGAGAVPLLGTTIGEGQISLRGMAGGFEGPEVGRAGAVSFILSAG